MNLRLRQCFSQIQMKEMQLLDEHQLVHIRLCFRVSNMAARKVTKVKLQFSDFSTASDHSM